LNDRRLFLFQIHFPIFNKWNRAYLKGQL
jgi:hypothetical protein